MPGGPVIETSTGVESRRERSNADMTCASSGSRPTNGAPPVRSPRCGLDRLADDGRAVVARSKFVAAAPQLAGRGVGQHHARLGVARERGGAIDHLADGLHFAGGRGEVEPRAAAGDADARAGCAPGAAPARARRRLRCRRRAARPGARRSSLGRAAPRRRRAAAAARASVRAPSRCRSESRRWRSRGASRSSRGATSARTRPARASWCAGRRARPRSAAPAPLACCWGARSDRSRACATPARRAWAACRGAARRGAARVVVTRRARVAITVGPTCGGRPAISSNSVAPSE